jgi:hypothetical protein
MRIRWDGPMCALSSAVAAMLLFSPCARGARSNGIGQTGTGQTASAAAPTYRAGLKSIAIPTPTNDLMEIGPDYRVLFETFAPNTNRLIAAFVLPSEAAALRSGGAEDDSTYALVEVPRAAEFKDVTPEIFKQMAEAVATEFGTNLDADVKKGTDEVNERLKDLNSSAAGVSMDNPIQLGTLFSGSDADGFGLISQVTAKGSTTKLATGVILVRVQNRVIFGYLFTVYKDELAAHVEPRVGGCDSEGEPVTNGAGGCRALRCPGAASA